MQTVQRARCTTPIFKPHPVCVSGSTDIPTRTARRCGNDGALERPANVRLVQSMDATTSPDQG